MEELNINWLALAAAAVSALVVGSIYYGPLFGKMWQKEVGLSDADLKSGNMLKIFGLSLVFAFFIAVTLWMAVMLGGSPGEAHGANPYLTFKHGALHGAMLGILLILPIIGTIALYERKSLRYVLLTVGYWTISMAIMGGIINVWP
ncbi:MAG: hypothetical protein ACI828_000045 [Flavobacteriales bacterium]|jgi:hypothetical protein